MMSSIKMLLYRLTIHNKHMDGFIRAIEYCRGLYRYPKKMLGRKVSHLTHQRQTDVLVFAAHPDDELLGVGTQLIRHKQNGEQVTVNYITNGAGEDGASWKFSKQTSKLIADTRYQEGIHGLSEIDISKEDIF